MANSVDLDEVAPYEPPHQDLHCLQILVSGTSRVNIKCNFAEFIVPV